MKITQFSMTAHRLVWRARRPWASTGNANNSNGSNNGNSRSREQGNGCVQFGLLGNPSHQ